MENKSNLILKTNKIIVVRSKIEGLTHQTWMALNAKDEGRINFCVEKYKLLREDLRELNVIEKEVAEYDTQFKSLPWKALGYKIPELN